MGVISAAIPNGDVDRSDAAGAAVCALPCLPFGSLKYLKLCLWKEQAHFLRHSFKHFQSSAGEEC